MEEMDEQELMEVVGMFSCLWEVCSRPFDGCDSQFINGCGLVLGSKSQQCSCR